MSEGGVPYDPSTYGGDNGPDRVDEVLARHESRLLGISGVEGCMTGQGPTGNSVIIVLISDEAARGKTPKSLEGVEVVVEKSGSIDAL
ncbi:MAG: hypothetical protein VYC34_07165 [Planctomycetota bacterium]|nr:hypothetical protein [Planctomycetota bacterium]